LLLLLLFIYKDEEIIGKVTHNGKGIAGAEIEYIEDNKKKSVTTDKDGEYVIGVDMDSYVAITKVTKDGHTVLEATVDDIPAELIIQVHIVKGVTTVNFMMT
ncbi:MAG: DUF4198 domain-containing protein, partial [Methanomassiliicoccaceae archaeon]|nr:DUF4198 domain-containing protein [Methanomassiliicoccaceae archaeon]